MAETLLIHVLVIESALENAAKDPQQMAQFSAAMNQASKQGGLNLQALELTEAGFVPANL